MIIKSKGANKNFPQISSPKAIAYYVEFQAPAGKKSYLQVQPFSLHFHNTKSLNKALITQTLEI